MISFQNCWRFISEVVSGSLVIFNRTKRELVREISTRDYQRLDDGKLRLEGGVSEEQEDDERGFQYLLNMPIYSLTQDRMKVLEQELDKKQLEFDRISHTLPEDTYYEDLQKLRLFC